MEVRIDAGVTDVPFGAGSGYVARDGRYNQHMASEQHLGRVASLAVVRGIGAAVVAGWSNGVARADASGNSSESTTSATASGASHGESGGATHGTRKPKSSMRATSATEPDKGPAAAADDGNRADPAGTAPEKGALAHSDSVIGPGDAEDGDSASDEPITLATLRYIPL